MSRNYNIDFAYEVPIKDEIEIGPTLLQPRNISEVSTSVKVEWIDGFNTTHTPNPRSPRIKIEKDLLISYEDETSDNKLFPVEGAPMQVPSMEVRIKDEIAGEDDHVNPLVTEELYKYEVGALLVSSNEHAESPEASESCDDKRPFRCEICNARFTRLSSLKKHKPSHSGDRPFRCDICNAKFTRADSLKKHTRKHNGIRPFECDICFVKFTESGHLKSHHRTHSGEKPFRCEICNATFAYAAYVKKHKLIHTGERPYVCNICNAKFTQGGSLEKHRKIHTGERPYKCEICNADFIEAGHLKRHLRIHTGQKPFQCDICNAKFTRIDHLKSHTQIHADDGFKSENFSTDFVVATGSERHKQLNSGEKPFECGICNAKFVQEGNLTRHLRIHTDDYI